MKAIAQLHRKIVQRDKTKARTLHNQGQSIDDMIIEVNKTRKEQLIRTRKDIESWLQ